MREIIVHDFNDNVSTRHCRNVPSEPSSESSRTLNVTDLLLPRSQATAVIGSPTSTARNQISEILAGTPIKNST